MAEPKRQDLEGDDRRRSARGPGDRYAEAGGVAALLRATRLQAGFDLVDVAGALRIQARYLEAIEDGRFEDLPGPTYAIGFVRAYAEFLRLDGKQIIRKFKDEARGLSRRQALVFPEPLQEGRFPGGVVLLVALLLAAAIYGGWYYYEHRQMAASEEVSQVPAELAKMVPDNSQPAQPAMAPSEAQASSATTAAPSGLAAGNTGGGASAPAAATLEPNPSSPAGRAGPPTSAPAVAGQSPAPAGPAAPAPKLALKPAEGMVTSDPARDAPTQAGRASAVPGSGAQLAPLAPPVPDQLAALKPGEARVYGENNVDSRVTLTARQDSWLQVRDRDGSVVWTRTLRAGESYRVPNQLGLTLVTGNAGALDVSVDGKAAPSLGGNGIVRRNIPLDPDKLASGTLPGQ